MVFQAGGWVNPMPGPFGAIMGLEGPVAHPPRLTPPLLLALTHLTPEPRRRRFPQYHVIYKSHGCPPTPGTQGPTRGSRPPESICDNTAGPQRAPCPAHPTGGCEMASGTTITPAFTVLGVPKPCGDGGSGWHGLCSHSLALVPSSAGSLHLPLSPLVSW